MLKMCVSLNIVVILHACFIYNALHKVFAIIGVLSTESLKSVSCYGILT